MAVARSADFVICGVQWVISRAAVRTYGTFITSFTMAAWPAHHARVDQCRLLLPTDIDKLLDH